MFNVLVSFNYLYYLCTINGSTIMARTIDEDTSYRVKIHKNGGYLYACAHPLARPFSSDRRRGLPHRSQHQRPRQTLVCHHEDAGGEGRGYY